ncbi:alpha/beta hydrolase [Bacillus thuringiensis]|uniref:alpha/beta hydrolase n=1 Tax=Bacillus thuringiensis TaxID=1428 RepID=UPI0021004D5C|nr:alpha/beta hydrolase [Bacillus thuringiensis]
MGVSYWYFSPIPKSYLIKKAFEGRAFVPSAHYHQALQKTTMVKDIHYYSKFPSGTLDIVYPKNRPKKTPIIFWVHGGGFVGGDKTNITGYAVELAAHGYIMVNINYALAPKNIYPTPVRQLGEAYMFIKTHARKYNVQSNHVYFAGDSAGAQIVAQFITIQTSEKYAKLMQMKAVVSPATIKGVLLFCGPYHMPALAQIESKKKIQDFIRTTGWAYLGEKNWEASSQVQTASILSHITSQFPDTFITDGNTGSFEEHGKELASVLRKKGVFVDSLFFNKNSSGELTHEFQFKMNTEAGLVTFNRVLTFLQRKSHSD